MSKLFNIFKNKNKTQNNQKKQNHNSLTKNASYYNTDREEYVTTQIPVHMNIINSRNILKKPSNLENVASILFHENTNNENCNFTQNENDTVSINLLQKIINKSTSNLSDTSYDSFFDNSDDYSDIYDSDYKSNVYYKSNSDYNSDNDSSEDILNTYLDIYDKLTKQSEKQIDNESDKDSVVSNIFSSKYRNKKYNVEPSELIYIPSEN
jgi:hypothetical protein